MASEPGRVLIVDDEPPVATMLKDAASMLGYAVQLAGTGLDALGIVPEFRPDVVLLDMTLPDIPGEIVLERLRGSDPHLPVVMITGNTDPDLGRRVLAQGAFDYIAKPFKLDRLAQVLEAAIACRP